jgi:hypothetical protein
MIYFHCANGRKDKSFLTIVLASDDFRVIERVDSASPIPLWFQEPPFKCGSQDLCELLMNLASVVLRIACSFLWGIWADIPNLFAHRTLFAIIIDLIQRLRL